MKNFARFIVLVVLAFMAGQAARNWPAIKAAVLPYVAQTTETVIVRQPVYTVRQNLPTQIVSRDNPEFRGQFQTYAREVVKPARLPIGLIVLVGIALLFKYVQYRFDLSITKARRRYDIRHK